MKRVAMVSPHFVPSNLVGAQRARLLSRHLPKFGWEPVIVTAHPRYYEEPLDLELESLLPKNLEIIRTRALPVQPLRVVGDIGVRAFGWLYSALSSLAQRRAVDFVYISIPSNFAALLGPLILKRFGTPYGLDFMDPWAHDWPGSEKRWSKAWISRELGYRLEPAALQRCSLITSVAAGYYEGLLNRYAWLSPARCETVPYGAEPLEFEYLASHPRATSLFNPHDGNYHFIYAGALLPRAHGTVDALLAGLRKLSESDPQLGRRIHFHFVGTGTNPKDPHCHGIQGRPSTRGLESQVHEHPARIPYLQVLNHLQAATTVMILGSSEAHYSPSKTFQALLSNRPVLALLHEKSAALPMLGDARAGLSIAFSDARPAGAQVDAIADALAGCVTYARPSLPSHFLESHSTAHYAKRLAARFDGVLAEGVEG